MLGEEYNDGYIPEHFIPYDELKQLREYIINKNNRNNKVNEVVFKEIGNSFYIWENHNKSDFGILASIGIVGNEEIISKLRSGIKSGTYRFTERPDETFNRDSANVGRGGSSNNVVRQRGIKDKLRVVDDGEVSADDVTILAFFNLIKINNSYYIIF